MKVAVTIIAFLLLVFTLLYSCRRMETPHRYFARHDNSLYDGLWVPSIFPTDIRQVHEQHNIDTNEVWVKFTLGSRAFSPIAHGYKETHMNPAAVRAPFFALWWAPSPDSKVFTGSCYVNDKRLLQMQSITLIDGQHVYWSCQYQ